MIKTKQFIIALIIIFGFDAPVLAQEAISLADCKTKALEHNQTIKAKEANYTSSEAAYTLSKRASLPQFDFNANYTYMNDPMLMVIPGFELPTVDGGASGVYYPGGTTNLSYHNSLNATVGMSLPLYIGGKLKQAKQIALHAKQIAESDIALSKTEVVLSVEQQYWALVSLFEQQKVIEKSIHFLEDVVVDMNNKYEIGIVTKNDVLKTKVELNNSKLVLLNISNSIKLASMSLNQSIGLGSQAELLIADTVINISQEIVILSSVSEKVNNRKEIDILNKQLEINMQQEKMVNADYLPQLVSFANYGFQNPNHLAQNTGELTWNAGLSLSIPVFHWGERKLKTTEAKQQSNIINYTLDRTKELLTLEIQQAIYRLNESIVNLEFTEESLIQSEENLQLEINRLEEDIITTTDLLNAQLQWQKAHADYISAKATIKINEAQYNKAIGNLNP